MAKLPPTKYELLLKESLSCFHCASEQKNMPKLKKHLQEEWEKLQIQAENRQKNANSNLKSTEINPRHVKGRQLGKMTRARPTRK